MRKCRFFLVIVLVILLSLTLVGCVKKDVTALVTHTEDSVTVYAEEPCILKLTIKIKDGEKTDTVTKAFVPEKCNEINLGIGDFVSGYYDENAIIIEVSYIEYDVFLAFFLILIGFVFLIYGGIFICMFFEGKREIERFQYLTNNLK